MTYSPIQHTRRCFINFYQWLSLHQHYTSLANSVSKRVNFILPLQSITPHNYTVHHPPREEQTLDKMHTVHIHHSVSCVPVNFVSTTARCTICMQQSCGKPPRGALHRASVNINTIVPLRGCTGKTHQEISRKAKTHRTP